jgi:ABC-type uncharacterized transport system ATPase subunit
MGISMQNEHDIVVHVEHLNKTFYSIRGYWRQKKHPVHAVKDISFSIGRGEMLTGIIYCLLGYLMFTWFEKLSLVDGQMETV